MAPEENATQNPPEPFEGFAAVVLGNGVPDDAGEPARAEAVETVETTEAPKQEAVKPDAPAAEEAKPVESKSVNFDGFSEKQKTTWERLLKAGSVTPEEVETARTESMFQSAWTRRNMAHAEKVKAWEKEVSGIKEDLELLKKIRDDDRLHDVWLKMSRGEVQADDAQADDLVDKKKAEEIADKRYEKREAEKADRTAKEQARYEAKKQEIGAAARETAKMLDIPRDEMIAYLEAEEAELNGKDPVLHFTPELLHERLATRHRITKAEAKVKELEAQLSKRSSTEARTSKASLPPPRRVASNGDLSPLARTEAELGLDPEWSNVQGFGFRPERQ